MHYCLQAYVEIFPCNNFIKENSYIFLKSPVQEELHLSFIKVKKHLLLSKEICMNEQLLSFIRMKI